MVGGPQWLKPEPVAGVGGTAETFAEKLSALRVLKGHGFAAVPEVFENDVRRG
jgi:hypothetical protein